MPENDLSGGGLIGGTVDANTPGKNPVDARRARKKKLRTPDTWK